MPDTMLGPARTSARGPAVPGTGRPDEPGPDAGARRLWAGLATTGVLAEVYRRDPDGELLLVPERLRALLRDLDARGPAGLTLSVCVQVASALPLLAGAGSPAADAALQAGLAGRSVTALAATDAGAAGSDLVGLQTEVHLDGDELLVRGGKRWVTNATCADQLLVLARHRPGRHFTSFTWVLVPATAPGVTVRPADTAAFPGAGIGHVQLEDVRLPGGQLVGRPGRGLAAFARHVTRERLAGAVWAAELCRRALAETRDHLAARTADGAPLWSLPVLRQRHADALVRLELLDALVARDADRIAGGYDPTAAAVLKVAAAETAEHVLGACARLQGADGYRPGGAREQLFQAGLFGIGGGTTDTVLGTVADGADALLAGAPR